MPQTIIGSSLTRFLIICTGLHLSQKVVTDARDRTQVDMYEGSLGNAHPHFGRKADVGPPSEFYSSYSGCNACSPPEYVGKSTCDPKDFIAYCNGEMVTCTMGETQYCDGEEIQCYCSQDSNLTCGDLSDDSTPKLAHMCPRMMLGTDLMIAAAEKDGFGSSHYYAVVGHDVGPDFGPDKYGNPSPDADLVDRKGNRDATLGCGQCYELDFQNSDQKPIIAQSFNTAAPSGDNDFNFDIYMAAGGYGSFNSCFRDPDSAEYGHNNNTALNSQVYTQYPSETFKRLFSAIVGNNKKSYIGTEAIWSNGGMRGSAAVQTAEDVADMENRGNGPPFVVDASVCYNLKAVDKQVTKDAQASCVEAFNEGYHFNAPSDKGGLFRVRRVKCPKRLVEVTGLHRQDSDLPDPLKDKRTGWFYGGNTSGTIIGTTTMEDCCLPTCAMKMNVDCDECESGYDCLYACDANGNVLLDDT